MSNTDSAPVSDLQGASDLGGPTSVEGRSSTLGITGLHESKDPVRIVRYMCGSSFCYKPTTEKKSALLVRSRRGSI